MNNEPEQVEQRESRRKYKLIFPDDRAVVAPFVLAEALGLETAVILQQMHFLLRNPKNGRVLPGRKGRWIYNTYEQWQKQHFPWMSVMSVRRRFRYLEKEKVIESCQPDGRYSRRKYYRLSDFMVKLTADELRSVRAYHRSIRNSLEAGH